MMKKKDRDSMSASREQLYQQPLGLFNASHAAKAISKIFLHEEFRITAKKNSGRALFHVVSDLSARFPGLFAELMKQWAQRVQVDVAFRQALQSDVPNLFSIYKQIKADAKLFEKEPLIEKILQLWTIEEKKFIPNRLVGIILSLLEEQNKPPFLKICVDENIFSEIIFPSVIIEQAQQHLVQIECLTRSAPAVMYMSTPSIYDSPSIYLPFAASVPNLVVNPCNNVNLNSTQLILKQIGEVQNHVRSPSMPLPSALSQPNIVHMRSSSAPESKLYRSNPSCLKTVRNVDVSRLPVPRPTSYLPPKPENPAPVYFPQPKHPVTTMKEVVGDVLSAVGNRFANR